MLDRAWTYSTADTLAHYGTDPRTGLDDKRVENNRKLYGENVLPEPPHKSLLSLILTQFEDKLVLILLGSAVVSFVLALFEDADQTSGTWLTAFVEPLVILLILVANAAVGVIQETKAEKAIDALREYSPDEAQVLRDGQVVRVPASSLVPGDVVSVHVGDRIAADCRILSFSSSSFRVDQAMLTGESMSVPKTDATVNDEAAVKQDQTNMLFAGTTVVNGAAHALVVLTGERTALGSIHQSISTDDEDEKTPLKRKLDDFGDQLAKVISVICVLVWLVNIRHFGDSSHRGFVKGAIYYLKIAVALAVAAIPEGLAAVITACLALGTKKMAKRGAIVRNLPSVETLGCTNVICSDKTGTLTTNNMSVARFLTTASDMTLAEYDVSGTTYEPVGTITTLDGRQPERAALRTAPVDKLVEICALCNDARVAYDTDSDSYTAVGEPTEAAMKVLVEKLGSVDERWDHNLGDMEPKQRVMAVNQKYESAIERLLTFEFSRDRKSMSVLTRADGSVSLLVKGAPESVIERCTKVLLPSGEEALTDALRKRLEDVVLEYGRRGLRTLALAYVTENDSDVSHYKTDRAEDYVHFEQDMVFVGLVGMLDPPRPEVREAIAKCRTAGIRTIVITGDNKNTAETICRDIGVFGRDEDLTGKSYTGRELDALSHEEKIAAVQRASLFSRTEPNHKQQLVDLLQGLGLVVAMTGDGVNDAPALKRADIGIAMGSGTDVAKLAADMVLATDNFATIERAVEEGRAIYSNTKQFIRYLISSNIGEVVSIFLTVLLSMPEALTPIQLLFVNLVTDGGPAIALGFNPADSQIMRTKPRDANGPLIGRWLFIRYLIIGTYVGAATVFGYAWWFIFYEGGPQISFYELTHFHKCSELFSHLDCGIFSVSSSAAKHGSTMSLSILVVIEMFNACNSLSENESLFSLPLWYNPYLIVAIAVSMGLHFAILYVPFLASLFGVTPLVWEEWEAVILVSAPVILIDEVLKFVTRTFIEPPSEHEPEPETEKANGHKH